MSKGQIAAQQMLAMTIAFVIANATRRASARDLYPRKMQGKRLRWLGSFFPWVITLFTLFTLFFDSVGWLFECKNS